MGIWTPWGLSDSNTALAPGIGSYSTPSHGGIHLDDEHNRKMPEAMRNVDGWYEEDCEWAKVAFVFPYAFKPEHVQAAIHTIKNWLPHEYEKVTGIKLKPEESMKLRDEIFHEAHKDHLQVVCAFGDWAQNVPKGMVGVIMSKGGLRINGERYFLVPEKEYTQSTFVIEDEKKYEEVNSDFTRITTSAIKAS
jgi:hypothetical protein